MHTSTPFSHRWSRILTSMWIFMWERRRSGRNALVLSGQPILYSSKIARYTFNNCILSCIEDGDWVTLSETMLSKAHGFIPCVCIFICQYIVGHVYWIMLLDGVYVGSWDDCMKCMMTVVFGQLWLLDGEAISSKVYMLTNCLVMHNCVWLKDNRGWRVWNKYKLLQVKSSYNCYCLWLWKKKINVGSGVCDSAECCCALEQLMLHMWAMQPYQHKCSLICPLDLLETMQCDFVISNSVQSHEGTRKSIEPSKLGLGTCAEIGTCTGQYNTIVDCTCAHDMVWKPDNLTLIQCHLSYTHMYIYIYIYIYIHTCMLTWTHICTHAHIHIVIVKPFVCQCMILICLLALSGTKLMSKSLTNQVCSYIHVYQHDY